MESRVSCPFTAYKSVHTGMNTDGLAADVARYNETCHRESMHRPFSPATKNIRSRIDYLNNLSIFYVLLPCQPISSTIFHPIYVPEIDRIIFPLFFLLYLSTRRARINWKISLQPFDRELILTHSVSVHFGILQFAKKIRKDLEPRF